MSRWINPFSWACWSAIAGLIDWQRPGKLHQLVQVGPFHELHGVKVGIANGIFFLIRLDDVGMVELGDGLHFALEPAKGLRVVQQLRVDDLEGDDAVAPFIPGLVDLADTPLAQAVHDAVAADGQLGLRFLKELIDLKDGEPAAPHQFLGQAVGIGKARYQDALDLVELRRLEQAVLLQGLHELRHGGKRHAAAPSRMGGGQG
jgi:hypothetical protein